MQNESHTNALAFMDKLDDDAFLQFQAATERRAGEIRTRKRVAAIEDVNSKIEFFGMTLKDLPALKVETTTTGTKGRTMPAQYFDADTGKGWTGNGTGPSEAMRAAREFDNKNPNAPQKRMDKFKIPDDKGGEISLALRKDVKTISGIIIKYNDLIAKASSQPVEQMTA